MPIILITLANRAHNWDQLVVRCTAVVAGVAIATITAGCVAISSFANAPAWSMLPAAAKRVSIPTLRPSDHPRFSLPKCCKTRPHFRIDLCQAAQNTDPTNLFALLRPRQDR